MAKQINFGAEARNGLRKGVDAPLRGTITFFPTA